ncbi:hypothetical protein, partial [Mesorhizobium sp. M8A.F.Ca.ET.021.01.1.1]|uniref:hypothetical protein n=1 Tax=Mesorhizobium sp. M8A.F.Ca.ET.021.01.1.1 TaxID=2496757 RepID=UPI001AECBFED
PSIGHDLRSSNVAWVRIFAHPCLQASANSPGKLFSYRFRPRRPIRPPALKMKICPRNFLSMLSGGTQFGEWLRAGCRKRRYF